MQNLTMKKANQFNILRGLYRFRRFCCVSITSHPYPPGEVCVYMLFYVGNPKPHETGKPMNETALDKLVAALARGNGEWAQAYLSHFPREVRAPKAVREGLAERVHPSVLKAIMDLHPWLLDDAPEDTPARIRLALQEAGTDGLMASELARKLRNLRVDEIAEAVDGMREAGEVMVERKRTKGRIAYVHRLAEFAHGRETVDEMRNPFAFVPEPVGN